MPLGRVTEFEKGIHAAVILVLHDEEGRSRFVSYLRLLEAGYQRVHPATRVDVKIKSEYASVTGDRRHPVLSDGFGLEREHGNGERGDGIGLANHNSGVATINQVNVPLEVAPHLRSHHEGRRSRERNRFSGKEIAYRGHLLANCCPLCPLLLGEARWFADGPKHDKEPG